MWQGTGSMMMQELEVLTVIELQQLSSLHEAWVPSHRRWSLLLLGSYVALHTY